MSQNEREICCVPYESSVPNWIVEGEQSEKGYDAMGHLRKDGDRKAGEGSWRDGEE